MKPVSLKMTGILEKCYDVITRLNKASTGLLGLRLCLSLLGDGKTGPKQRFNELMQLFSHSLYTGCATSLVHCFWHRDFCSCGFLLSKGPGVGKPRAGLGI